MVFNSKRSISVLYNQIWRRTFPLILFIFFILISMADRLLLNFIYLSIPQYMILWNDEFSFFDNYFTLKHFLSNMPTIFFHSARLFFEKPCIGTSHFEFFSLDFLSNYLRLILSHAEYYVVRESQRNKLFSAITKLPLSNGIYSMGHMSYVLYSTDI